MKTYYNKYALLCLFLTGIVQWLSAQEICNQTFNQQTNVSLVAPIPTELPVTDGEVPINDGGYYHDGERIIYWLHGLSGNEDSWARASAATSIYGVDGYPARKIFSLNPTYTEFDLQSAAWNLHQSCVTLGDPVDQAIGNTDPKNNFIIAHSQGGLVARALDKMYWDNNMEEDRRIGGIVTFGTAHQGALILNNYDQIIDYADLICTELTIGPVTEEILSNFWLRFLVSEQAIQETADVACEFFSHTVLPVALTAFQPNITQDYEVGAPDLEVLNNYLPNIPTVAFYGVEQEPILWRNIQYLGVDNPNDYDPFEADTDDKLVQSAAENTMKYLGKQLYWESTMSDLEEWGFPCGPLEWIFMSVLCSIWDTEYWVAYSIADAWERGYHWFANANYEYKLMIGAIQFEYSPRMYCGCYPQDDDWVDDFNFNYFPITHPAQCPSECWMEEIIEIQPMAYESDGVVLANSAAALPGANFVSRMSQTSHMQMRNNSELKSGLNRLFEGEFGWYFKTDER